MALYRLDITDPHCIAKSSTAMYLTGIWAPFIKDRYECTRVVSSLMMDDEVVEHIVFFAKMVAYIHKTWIYLI